MRKATLLLIAFLVVKIVVQLSLIHPVYELHRDEYLHLDQGHHLAAGYLSVPPLTAWLSALVFALGGGAFWVKLFPALFGAATLWIVWKMAEALGGGLFSRALAATGVLLSALLRLNTLYQPNSFDVLAWTAFYAVVLRYLQTGRARWIYTGALAAAVGLLNKYNFAFLLAGLLPALLLSRHRAVLASRHFYGALLLCLLLLLPNLLWQYNNHFPVIHHMKELSRTQLAHVQRSDFLKEQLLYFLGSLPVLAAALPALLRYRPFRSYRLFASGFAFTLLLFLLLQAKGYYAIGLYPALLPFGAVYLEHRMAGGWLYRLRPLLPALNLLLFIPLWRIGFPNKTPGAILQNPAPYQELGLLRWEDGQDHPLPQDFADMLGWKELASLADSALAQLPPREHSIVLCDNYGEAGAINYYSRRRDMNAVSFNADYIFWLPLDKPVQNVVLVKDATDGDPRRSQERPLFDTVYRLGVLAHPYAREKGTSVYVLRGARADINARLEAERRERLAFH